MIAGECRICGCTSRRACIVVNGARLGDEELERWSTIVTYEQLDALASPCTWIEPDLCSACVEQPPPPPLLYDVAGNPLRAAP
jgi:hypothetical protein